MGKLSILAFVSILSLALTCSSNEGARQAANDRLPGAAAPALQKLTYVTSDSLLETAWFRPSTAGQKAPLLITLHMLGTDHTSFDRLEEAVKTYVDTSAMHPPMPSLLSFDLRGHGESTKKGSAGISYTNMPDADFERIPRDVFEMTRDVIDRNRNLIDTANITVIGASIGANSAMILTQEMPYVSKVILLSPGGDYRGLKPDEAFKSFDGQTYLMTGQNDAYSNKSSQALARLKMENWLLKIYPTDKHGTEIIDADQRPMDIVLEWIFGKPPENAGDSAN